MPIAHTKKNAQQYPSCLFEDRDDVVPCPLGERTQIAFLPFAGLILGADAAVDGYLSQLNPQEMLALKMPKNKGHLDANHLSIKDKQAFIVPAAAFLHVPPHTSASTEVLDLPRLTRPSLALRYQAIRPHR